MAKTNQCKDCGTPCDKRCERCQPCSNILNGKSRPRHPKLCKCGAELAKSKYELCHSCNMKARWADKNYKDKTTATMRSVFDAKWANPTIRMKIIGYLIDHHGTSKLEKRVAKVASQFGFDHSVAIGRYLADLLNEDEKIIVEVNGDLWHCNPKYWNADDIHPNKKVSAQTIWDKDAKRKEYLELMGYSVFVLWEDDIIKGKDKFVKEFFTSLRIENDNARKD